MRTLPSIVSGVNGVEPHHVKGHGMGGTVKAPDWAVIPLTREEHTALHAGGWQTWERANGSQLEHVARTLGKAIQDGVIQINGEK